METTFMNLENSKTNEQHQFILNLPQRLDLKNTGEHVALQNLTIYYTWKNIRKQSHKQTNKRTVNTRTTNITSKTRDSITVGLIYMDNPKH